MYRWMLILLNVVATVALVSSGAFAVIEKTWVKKADRSLEEEFLYGSTGTELVPFAVFQVLPDLFPEHFQPAGPSAGDWVEQFGFQRGPAGKNHDLPFGMFVSHHRPGSGDPSPIPFVGFNCAVCHTGRLLPVDGVAASPDVIYGMGSSTIDLVPFGDALKSSFLDPRLTVEAVDQLQQAKFQRSLSLVERLVIQDWIGGARASIERSFPLRDKPYGGKDLRNPVAFRAGPARNEPMKETVRFLIDRTPSPDGGPSKIPSVFMQAWREWAQFDGSLGDPLTRNSLAALGVGSSLNGLRQPEIFETVVRTSEFVASLRGPKFRDVFPEVALDAQRVEHGRRVYTEYCTSCHGHPGAAGDTWVRGERQGQIVPVLELGTDPSRVNFRYYSELGEIIDGFFPEGHPLKPSKERLRPGLSDSDKGYINSPLESVFARAPYLHNGSVLNLAQLINLEPRERHFYRGKNRYDPAVVGLVSPAAPTPEIYFEFDATSYGNGNAGHDYPWAYDDPQRDPEALAALLEYLKTF